MSEKHADLIRKLLAKANDTGCTPEEAESFMAKAYELMAKFNIDAAALEPKDSVPERTIKELKVLVRPWSTRIIGSITKLYFCKWYYQPAPKGKPNVVRIIGREDNAYVAHSILVTVLRSVQTAGRPYGRSFLNGAASKIAARCAQLQSDATDRKTSDSTTLMVVYDKEQKLNQEFLEQLVPNLTTRVSRAQARDAHGYNKGVEHGSRVTLTRTINNPTKRLQ